METRSITVHVDSETATVYESLSEKDRRKYDLIINLRLKEVVKEARTLEEVIADISRRAQERGLTPDILESILTDS